MIFVVVLWILGFLLAVAVITDGLVNVLGERRRWRRVNHLGISAQAFRALAAAQIVAGLGLLLSALAGHPKSWPALFQSSVLVWFGLAAVLFLITVKATLVGYHRRAGDDMSEYASAMTLALLCVAYLIAFLAREIAAS